MPVLTGFRLGGLIAGLVALAAAVTWLVATVRDRDRLAGLDTAHRACVAAIGAKAATEPAIVAACPQVLADAASLAMRGRDCDAALARADAYSVAASCSAPVKRRDAQAQAFAATNASLETQLAGAERQLADGLARADARVATLLGKDAHAKAAIAAAPRQPDGRIRCDDRCLRDLAGDDAVAARR